LTLTHSAFTREVKRLGTQIEAAARKTQATEIAGETLALPAKVFGPHPMMPYLPANREIVILLDRTAI